MSHQVGPRGKDGIDWFELADGVERVVDLRTIGVRYVSPDRFYGQLRYRCTKYGWAFVLKRVDGDHVRVTVTKKWPEGLTFEC